jgi:hypothetical protein
MQTWEDLLPPSPFAATLGCPPLALSGLCSRLRVVAVSAEALEVVACVGASAGFVDLVIDEG